MTRLLSALESVVRRAPATLVVATILVTAVFGGVATQAVQEQGFENFSPDNEVTAALTTISEEFSSGLDRVFLVVESEGGPLLAPDGVAAAVGLRDALLADPVIAAVVAPVPGGAVITYADLVTGSAAAQGLEVTDLDAATLATLQQEGLAALPAEQVEQATQLLAGDGDGTGAEVGAVLVLLDGQEPFDARSDALDRIGELIVDVPGVTIGALDFRLLGDEVAGSIESELTGLLGLAFLLIIGILIAIYRRPVDVLSSLLGLVFTIVWMRGISTLLGPGFLGWTGGMSEMSMAIPILLVGLGVDYGIHLTMRYREERARGNQPGDAATGAIHAVGTALALATLTTAVGFMTNQVNPLPPLQDFGVFAAVGVVSAFLIMTTFVPAVRLMVDRFRERRGHLKPEVAHGDESPTLLGRLAASLAPMATHRPWAVLAVAAVLTIAGSLSATNLSTEFSQTEFFPDDAPALRTIELADEAFGGDLTERTYVLVQGDVDQPGVLAAVDAFERDIRDLDTVRARNGRADTDSVLARTRGVLDALGGGAAGAPEAGEQMPDPAVIGGFMEQAARVGLAGRDGQPLTDPSVPSDATWGELTAALLAVDPSAGAVVSDDALLVSVATSAGEDIDDLRVGLQAAAGPLEELGLSVAVASENILVADVMDELQSSQIAGLATTLLASMLILALAFWFRVREPMLGVLAIVSVGLVVAWVLGLMAALGIPFNVMTAMVSALAIGIGVPFGIHVVNRFLEDRDRFEDLGDALRSTLRNTGGALVGSAVTTIAGFGSLVLSSVPPFRQFGAVTAMTIGLALLSSVVVLPALLSVYERFRGRRRATASGEEPVGGVWTAEQPPSADRVAPLA